MIQILKTDFWSFEMCDIQHYNEVLQRCPYLQILFSIQYVSRPFSVVLTLTGLRDIDINWRGDINKRISVETIIQEWSGLFCRKVLFVKQPKDALLCFINWSKMIEAGGLLCIHSLHVTHKQQIYLWIVFYQTISTTNLLEKSELCASFLLYRTVKEVVCCRCGCWWSQIEALFVRFQFRCWQFGFPGLTHLLLPVGKFNQGVSAEAKKQTWAEITNQINGLGENHREVCYCHLTDTICENLQLFSLYKCEVYSQEPFCFSYRWKIYCQCILTWNPLNKDVCVCGTFVCLLWPNFVWLIYQVKLCINVKNKMNWIKRKILLIKALHDLYSLCWRISTFQQ